MASTLAQAADALRAELRVAARDNFEGVMAEDLGPRLCKVVDGVLARSANGSGEPFQAVRGELTDFDACGRQDRTAMVARLLRLARGLPTVARAPKPRPAPDSDEDPLPRLTSLPGIGPAMAEKLGSRGLCTVEDLAFLLPRGYQDRRVELRLATVEEGATGLVRGRVETFRQGYVRGRRYMATVVVVQEDSEGPKRMEARWFHRVGGLARRLQAGAEVVLVGTVKHFRGTPAMVHPEVHATGSAMSAVAVRYPVVEGVGQARLGKFCRAAVDALATTSQADRLPDSVAKAAAVMPQIEALRRLHAPQDDLDPEEVVALDEGRSLAHRRLAFDELFFLQLAVLVRREAWRSHGAAVVAPSSGSLDRERLRAAVPFEPTGAQWRALEQVEADLRSGSPMLRLLQGDVGSGKTLVAFGAALALAGAGGLSAVMAPTEILAEQHLRTLTPWCEAAGLRIALLTGSTPRAERLSRLSMVAAGRVDLLVGTHALLTKDVGFSELGLTVVDEQHRFGVAQRARLRHKGAAPHLLVMTATPIPRTLALTAYGELDVSVLDELPPGRAPTRTRLFVGRTALDQARAVVVDQVERGAQAFVVCPLVEASDALDVSDVEAAAGDLRDRVPGKRVALVHGRMKSTEKDAVMRQFRDAEVDLLVATTVIEVGVDVPSATVMLVEHAERFGLAQLHQLRGRVGRGQQGGLCLLHTASGRGSEAARRLAVMKETSDGFVVAERDLQLRGPGEIFGMRQAGIPRLRFTGFGGEGLRLLVEARNAAQTLLDGDPGLSEHSGLRAELERRDAARPTVGAESG